MGVVLLAVGSDCGVLFGAGGIAGAGGVAGRSWLSCSAVWFTCAVSSLIRRFCQYTVTARAKIKRVRSNFIMPTVVTRWGDNGQAVSGLDIPGQRRQADGFLSRISAPSCKWCWNQSGCFADALALRLVGFNSGAFPAEAANKVSGVTSRPCWLSCSVAQLRCVVS